MKTAPVGRFLAAGLAGLALPASAAAQQGPVGISGGADLWLPGFSGEAEVSDDNLELDQEVDGEADTTYRLWADWSLPVPVIPSFAFDYTPIRTSGSGEISQSFGDITANTDVDMTLDIDQVDVTAYWTPLPTPNFDLDFGVTGRAASFDFTAEGANQSESVEGTVPIPMVFGRVSASVPTLPVDGYVKTKHFQFVEDTYYNDTEFAVAYQWRMLAARLGYRWVSANADIDGDQVDVSFNGLFLGGRVSF